MGIIVKVNIIYAVLISHTVSTLPSEAMPKSIACKITKNVISQFECVSNSNPYQHLLCFLIKYFYFLIGLILSGFLTFSNAPQCLSF